MSGTATVTNVRLIDFDEVTPGQIFRAYAGTLTNGEVVTGDEDTVEQRTGNVFIDIDSGNAWFYDEKTEGWKLPGQSAGGES